MQRRNYQKELERILERQEREKIRPRLLLHSCCAPCSSYVLEYLSAWFDIVLFYYNPNIDPPSEYDKRVKEQERLIHEMEEAGALSGTVEFARGEYDPGRFYEAVKGHENDPEGGERCGICYRLRLGEAKEAAERYGCDYFTTTLSISPLKNAERLNRIGEELAADFGARYLPSDFKKRDGYKRSIQLSAQYGLYRQDYCGCIFSRRERLEEKKRFP